jgi:hypothetical protein
MLVTVVRQTSRDDWTGEVHHSDYLFENNERAKDFVERNWRTPILQGNQLHHYDVLEPREVHLEDVVFCPSFNNAIVEGPTLYQLYDNIASILRDVLGQHRERAYLDAKQKCASFIDAPLLSRDGVTLLRDHLSSPQVRLFRARSREIFNDVFSKEKEEERRDDERCLREQRIRDAKRAVQRARENLSQAEQKLEQITRGT